MEGVYVLPALAPGNILEAQAAGFQRVRVTGVKLDGGQSAKLDFALKTGDVQQSVTVNAETALVKTDSAPVSTVINRDLIENLSAQPIALREKRSMITAK